MSEIAVFDTVLLKRDKLNVHSHSNNEINIINDINKK